MVLVSVVTGLWFGGFEGRVYIYVVGWVWVLDFGLGREGLGVYFLLREGMGSEDG